MADIASDRVNLGLDAEWSARWRASLRVRYVGARKTGVGTTVPANPFDQMDASTTADATVSYRDLLPGATLQLIVDNLLDANIYDPGTDFQIGAPSRPPGGENGVSQANLGLGSSRRRDPDPVTRKESRMAASQTPANYALIVAKAWHDPAFRTNFLANPKEVLNEHGWGIPEATEVAVVPGDGPAQLKVHLPDKPANFDAEALNGLVNLAAEACCTSC